MWKWQELRAVGHAARHLPGAVLRRGCETVHTIAEDNERSPVLLVHGYAGSETVWQPLRDALAAAGFGHLVSLNYNSFATDALAVSDELARQVLLTRAARVHLVGHSLGGLIVRQTASDPRVADVIGTAVTIASPHRGAPLARIAPGRCAHLMQHRARAAMTPAGGVRWVAYYSDGDRVVPATSARLDQAGYAATNVLVPGCGHLGICRDPRLISCVVAELLENEFAEQTLVAA